MSLHELSGTVQNDILKEYIARGTYIFPPRPPCGSSPTFSPSAATELPQWTTISICGYHIREAGSTAAQEVAFTLADAIAYVEAALARGPGASTTSRPGFPFSSTPTTDLLEEIAKFRAARRLWARLMRERFGARDPRSMDASLSRADRRLDAHRAAAGRQRGARGVAGAGRRAGRYPVPPHQRARRGARSAHRSFGAARSAHPADPRPRNRRSQHRGPVGRLLLHREADR